VDLLDKLKDVKKSTVFESFFFAKFDRAQKYANKSAIPPAEVDFGMSKTVVTRIHLS
jgi:hypothetical protein